MEESIFVERVEIILQSKSRTNRYMGMMVTFTHLVSCANIPRIIHAFAANGINLQLDKAQETWPELLNFFHAQQLSMKFQLLIKTKKDK